MFRPGQSLGVEISDSPDTVQRESTARNGRLRVLISAYACEPGKGSEPGVGWHVAREVSKYHDVWVITRANNRESVDAAIRALATSALRPIYFDLPRWLRWWKRGNRGVQLYYYLWQIGAFYVARKLHRRVRFDLVHHATFVKYWVPSFLMFLPVPFVWGPVGGGESPPWTLLRSLGAAGVVRESFRNVVRWLSERDPFVGLTARRAAVVLATTPETANRVRKLGARKVHLLGESGLSIEDFRALSSRQQPGDAPLRLASVGRLVPVKGFHLVVRAVARAGLPGSEYWVVGDGPERRRLERLAAELGLSDRVRFLGRLPRSGALQALQQCHILIHPSLHDSGGWVCLEAMAAGLPVICLDIGGPGAQVSEDTGVRIPPSTAQHVVHELAAAIRRLAANREERVRLGRNGRAKVRSQFLWEMKGALLAAIYRQAVSGFASSPASLHDSPEMPSPVHG